jgi:hypothetical protein
LYPIMMSRSLKLSIGVKDTNGWSRLFSDGYEVLGYRAGLANGTFP